jgi:isopropylmalate/citramalate/homocitrate synthase-like protein
MIINADPTGVSSLVPFMYESGSYVSEYLVRSRAKRPERVYIFDTTLRDGEQTPWVSFTVEEKIEIARQLDALGVDVIEVGTPIASEGDRKAAMEISKLGLDAEVCGLARVVRGDIDAALKCDVDRVHVFVSTSDIQIQHAIGMDQDQVLEASVDSIQYVKNHGLTCEYSPMDASRTDFSYLMNICKAAEEAGADIINVPDTVGVMTPPVIIRLIEDISKEVDVPLSVHCHNDFGMAVANTLAAVEGGAIQAEVAVNGLGERAGNAALEEVVMAMKLIYGWKTGIKVELLYETSQLVSNISGVVVQPNKAIVGENAFAHESGIHTRGIAEVPLTFEPIDPEMVGRSRRFVAGKVSGTRGIKTALEDMNLQPTASQLRQIVLKVKEEGDRGRTITDVDLYDIARDVMEIEHEDRVKLKQLLVVTGNTVTPTASVTLLVDEKEYIGSGVGNGPIDSATNAIKNVVDGFADIRLERFSMKAIAGGTDALADVTVRLSRDKKDVISNGVSGDTVMASVIAILRGMNRLL